MRLERFSFGRPTQANSAHGTSAGTVAVTTLKLAGTPFDPSASAPTDAFAARGGYVYFANLDQADGPERFKTDGTTTLVMDLFPGPEGSTPRDLTVGGSLVFFIGHDVPGSNQIFRTDGTAAGTFSVASFSPARDASSLTATSFQIGDTLNSKTLILANDGIHGNEIWATDGTSGGTFLLKDINPTGGIIPNTPTTFHGETYFGVGGSIPNVSGLWRSDGTSAGTVLVEGFNSDDGTRLDGGPDDLTDVGGSLFFVADDGTSSGALWKTDGTAGGTVLTTKASTYTGPISLTAVGTTLFFVGNESVNGTSLWKSDGPAAGTVLLKVIHPGNTPYAYHYVSELTAVGSTLFFMGNDGTHGPALWSTDGTAAGTTMLMSAANGLKSGNVADEGVLDVALMGLICQPEEVEVVGVLEDLRREPGLRRDEALLEIRDGGTLP